MLRNDNPRVFISYSHDSPEHADRVLQFSEKLRADGIEAILDQYEAFGPPDGWPRWMTKQIRDAEFVLMVCTETYYLRVMGDEKPGTGKGVVWEGNLIFQHIYDAQSKNSKFLPVLFSDGVEEHVPDPIRPFSRFRLDESLESKPLYRCLTSQPEVQPGPLGKLRALPTKERRQDFFAPDPPHNIPRSGAHEFVGREKVFDELDRKLAEGGPTAIASLKGMGGVGKTEFAIRYAGSRLNVYPGGVCWVKACGVEAGVEILKFSHELLDSMPPDTIDQLDGRLRWVWTHWPREGRVLVVLDDVTKWEDAEAMLPPSPSRFDVLLTSRKNLGTQVNTLELDILEPSEAHALLQSFIKEDRFEPAQAHELCKRLGYLPLGIELVGRYLERSLDLSLEEMLLRLDSKGLTQAALANSEPGMTAEKGVQAAFDLSWEELGELPKRLACLLGNFALSPIPWDTVKQCFPSENEEDLEKARDIGLLGLSLLQRQGKGVYELHQLIRDFFRIKQDALEDKELKSQFVRVLISECKSMPKCPTISDVEKVSELIPHLEELATYWSESMSEDELLWPYIAIGRFYEGQGLLWEAEPWYEKSIIVCQSRSGTSHWSVATSLNNLAELYKDQGRYDDAKPLLEQALEMCQELFKDEHVILAASMNNLAGIYYSLGRYESAESLLHKALEMRRNLLGQEHPDVAGSLNDLAILYQAMGRYEDAEKICKQALEMERKLLGVEHPNLATSMNNLALLYQAKGRYEEAEPLFIQALEMRRKLHGDDHVYVANSLHNIAFLRQAQGKLEVAEALFLKALEMRCRLLGQEHPDVASNLSNIAFLHQTQGRYEKAEAFFRRALAMRRNLLGQEHPEIVNSLNNLAGLCHSQGRIEDAEKIFKQALEMGRKLLGDEHPFIATILSNIAGMYQSQGRCEDAKPLYETSLDILSKSLGPEHPETRAISEVLASCR